MGHGLDACDWPYSRRAKLAHRTKDSESSSWPTARASDQEKRTTKSAPTHGNSHGEVLAGVACDFMARWHTPVANDHVDRAKGKFNSRGEPKLSARSQIWGTPRASDAGKGGPNLRFGSGGMDVRRFCSGQLLMSCGPLLEGHG